MKIVNLKKFIRSIVVIVLVLFILSLVFAKSSLSHREKEYTKLSVASGDTLWNIAKDLQRDNEFYKEKDIRYIISDIKSLNDLGTSSLYVGQELIIPLN